MTQEQKHELAAMFHSTSAKAGAKRSKAITNDEVTFNNAEIYASKLLDALRALDSKGNHYRIVEKSIESALAALKG